MSTSNELIIGLVGGVGTDFDTVIREIQSQAINVNFLVQEIKLSEELKKYIEPQKSQCGPSKKENETARIKKMITLCNNFRKNIKRNDADEQHYGSPSHAKI